MRCHVCAAATGVALTVATALGSGRLPVEALAYNGVPLNPGSNELFQNLSFRPVISDDGTIAFFGATLSPTTGARTGIFAGRPGDLHAVAYQGMQVPGAPDGTVFEGLEFTTSMLSMNSSGQFAFSAFAVPEGTTDLNGGVWIADETGLHEALQAGGEFGNFGATRSLRIDDSGRVAIIAHVNDAETLITAGAPGDGAIKTVPTFYPNDSPGDLPDRRFVLSSESGQVAVRLQDGLYAGRTASDFARVMGPYDLLTDLPGAQIASLIDVPATNATGTLGIRVRLFNLPGSTVIHSEQDKAIAVAGPNGTRVIAREGQAAPGMPDGVTFGFSGVSTIDEDFAQPVILDDDSVVFAATANGPGVTFSTLPAGIWREDAAGIQPLVLASDPVPGGAPGDHVSGIFDFDANDSGMMAIVTGRGLFGYDGHELFTIALRNESFEVAPGVFNTVYLARLGIAASGGDDGRPNCLNSRGELVFELQFTDGRRGVFYTQIPAPAAPGLAAPLAFLLVRRRRRAHAH